MADRKMSGKLESLELQVKAIEKGMGVMVKAFKEIKASMNKLEEKVDKTLNAEIQEIIKTQKNVEEMIAANSDAIQCIDSEISKFQNDKAKAASDKHINVETIKELKKCKYFNKGHCKYKLACKFAHPREVCENHLRTGKCYEKLCKSRHPKVCKWWQESGCRRQDCNYLHVTLASDDDKGKNAHESESYTCSGCRNCFDDKSCVVQHRIENTTLFLCLNCDGWIQKKEKIIHPGWSLYDQFGDLRRDV